MFITHCIVIIIMLNRHYCKTLDVKFIFHFGPWNHLDPFGGYFGGATMAGARLWVSDGWNRMLCSGEQHESLEQVQEIDRRHGVLLQHDATPAELSEGTL